MEAGVKSRLGLRFAFEQGLGQWDKMGRAVGCTTQHSLGWLDNGLDLGNLGDFLDFKTGVILEVRV